MSELHILVCMKVVPKPEEIRVDPETLRIEREIARSEFNPPDMNALEMALRIKDRHGGRVSLLSMAPPFVEKYLRIGLAMGADTAYLLSDRGFAGADTLATTYTLAQGIEKIGSVDLILCGEESSDGATGQVPAGIAEWLNLPQITLVTEFDVDIESKTVQARRDMKGGYEILEAPLPAVLSAKTASNEPRFMDYRIKDYAFEEALVTIWSCEDIEAEETMIGTQGSPTIVTGLAEAETRERKRELLSGSEDEIAKQLMIILRETME
jgi:electron transfer flavoprotein beta subunit